MEKAQKAVDAVAGGMKKVVIGEKKPKAKKEKSGDGGAESGRECSSRSNANSC